MLVLVSGIGALGQFTKRIGLNYMGIAERPYIAGILC